MSRTGRPARPLSARYFALASGGVLLVTVVAFVIGDVVGHWVFDPNLTDDTQDAHDSFGPALRAALAVGLGTGLVVALLLAVAINRRMARPIDQLSRTARRLADGHYEERVVPTGEPVLVALATDVNTLAESLETNEQRRRELVDDLTHELRNPIATVSGFIEGMQDGVIEPDAATLAEMAEEVSRLDRLTADLALLSRLDEGVLQVDTEPLDLGESCRKAAARITPSFESCGVVLVVAPGPAATVEADPDRLAEILMNVLANALRYTPEGGVVEVSWGTRGDRGWCAVTDTGRGLSSDELERVFHRFARGQSAVGTTGSGLGLSIARGLARRQGGDLVASSAGPGLGATFTVELPGA